MKPIQMRKTRTILMLAAFVAATWTSGAIAGEAQSGATAVSGGVSLNSRDELRSKTPPHNVKMIFALNTGNYVADVNVKMTDSARRTVIEEVSSGPWFFVKVPPGSYIATATYNGKAVTQRVSVGRTGARTVIFRWPASVELATSTEGEAGGRILGTGPQEPQR